MLDLLKFLHPAAEAESPNTEMHESQHSVEELRDGYHALVADQLRRGGIPEGCVQFDPRLVGTAADGRPVFLGMLRLVQWDRRPVVRLLLGLPVFEKTVKRLVRASWLQEVSHFGGLWLHPSTGMQSSEALDELRALLLRIEAEDSQPPHETPVWSVPPAGETGLGELEPPPPPHP